MTTKIDGQLEIDHDRGVIYFHNGKTGATVLRICSLTKPIPFLLYPISEMLDITHMYGTSWDFKTTGIRKSTK